MSGLQKRRRTPYGLSGSAIIISEEEIGGLIIPLDICWYWRKTVKLKDCTVEGVQGNKWMHTPNGNHTVNNGYLRPLQHSQRRGGVFEFGIE